jgi:hypothetical protein
MLLGFDIVFFSLKSSLGVKLRKLVVEANVLAMKSSCSRNAAVESSGDLVNVVSLCDTITVLAAFRWTCQTEESVSVSTDTLSSANKQ